MTSDQFCAWLLGVLDAKSDDLDEKAVHLIRTRLRDVKREQARQLRVHQPEFYRGEW